MANINSNLNPYANPSFNRDRLRRQREEIDFMLNSMDNIQPPQQTPVNNIINTQQPINNDSMYTMKILNENDEAENIFINENTIFIGTNKMQIKKLDGTIEKYNIKRYYPVDVKDKKIEDLTSKLEEKDKEIEALNKKMEDIERRLNNNEPSKSNESTKYGNKSFRNDDEFSNTKSNTNHK